MGNVSDPSSVEYLSSNMTIEHITASGLGLVVGSIERSTVRNITFQHSYLYRTFKGIYFKFREAIEEHKKFPPGLIEDVTFHNITMDSPQQWPIWIGPAQQAVSNVGGEDDDGDTRGLMSQSTNVADALAPTVESIPQSRNGITKRGAHYCQFFLFTLLILGCTWYWFVQAQTHNVTKYYVCEGVVDGVALGDTWPVPFCLRDETTATNPTAEDGYYISSLSPTFVLVMIVLEGIAVAGSFSIIAALLPGANIERFNGEAVRDQDAVASIDIDDSRPHQQDDPLPDDEL
eukprot:Nitzschia sp. Nitz4//scaffold75_size92586//46392//47750//NITZ4_004855-RA/size92586-augustus-gene-0.163-mRNA-1//-1//CDS//3329557705//8344//frame0